MNSAQNSALKPRVAPSEKILRHRKSRPIGQKIRKKWKKGPNIFFWSFLVTNPLVKWSQK